MSRTCNGNIQLPQKSGANGACADSLYQALFEKEPGNEARAVSDCFQLILCFAGTLKPAPTGPTERLMERKGQYRNIKHMLAVQYTLILLYHRILCCVCRIQNRFY